MKVLITGGAGFIGSHLAEALLQRGDSVSIIDNLSTGCLENISHLTPHPHFHATIDTIMNHQCLEQHVQNCDLIYHLAAAVGVKLIMEKPVETIETNVFGTEHVLKLANTYKKKVLLTSTSEIYGKKSEDGVSNGRLSENDDRVMGAIVKRRWAYACSKALDEFLALAYYEEKRLPVVITRLFNTVGPRQTGQYGMVIPNFVQNALLNKPLLVYGDGTQSRSFTYVCDVVQAMIDLMHCPAAEGDIFNIGNGEEITIKDLATKVIQMTDSKSQILYVPYEDVYGYGFEDMHRRSPDIEKIKSIIDFNPTVDIEGILQSVIEYFKK